MNITGHGRQCQKNPATRLRTRPSLWLLQPRPFQQQALLLLLGAPNTYMTTRSNAAAQITCFVESRIIMTCSLCAGLQDEWTARRSPMKKLPGAPLKELLGVLQRFLRCSERSLKGFVNAFKGLSKGLAQAFKMRLKCLRKAFQRPSQRSFEGLFKDLVKAL